MARQIKKSETPASKTKTGELGFPRLHVVLALTAEVVSLLGLLGFVIAVVYNSIIFRWWGLTFLQVATPSDTILSGIQVGVALLPALLGVPAGWLLGAGLYAFHLRHQRFWLTMAIWLGTNLVIFWVAPRLIDFASQVYLFTPWVVSWSEFYVPALFAVALATSGWFAVERMMVDVPLEEWSGPVHSIFNRRWKRLVLFLPAVLFIAADLGSEPITQFQASGMFSEGSRYIVRPRLSGCSRARVLWAGERSVVVRCEDRLGAPIGSTVQVLHHYEDIQIGTDGDVERAAYDGIEASPPQANEFINTYNRFEDNTGPEPGG